ncbi:hypothetical protein NQZ68_015588 [Dissostichus eleginoides]|nr:hypothetical protein NQZ68_015588 [Dissostichus eleginoides]
MAQSSRPGGSTTGAEEGGAAGEGRATERASLQERAGAQRGHPQRGVGGGPRNGPSQGGGRGPQGAAVGVVANEENILQPQKAGSLCDVGTGVNIPVVPSREERCPAAGEGTAAAGTKPSGGRSRGQGRGQTGRRPKPPSRRTVSRG